MAIKEQRADESEGAHPAGHRRRMRRTHTTRAAGHDARGRKGGNGFGSDRISIFSRPGFPAGQGPCGGLAHAGRSPCSGGGVERSCRTSGLRHTVPPPGGRRTPRSGPRNDRRDHRAARSFQPGTTGLRFGLIEYALAPFVNALASTNPERAGSAATRSCRGYECGSTVQPHRPLWPQHRRRHRQRGGDRQNGYCGRLSRRSARHR